jgi:NhaP-type Na+/H+ or K+/H+ antiporter
MLVGAGRGFEFGDVYALGLLFAGVVLFAATLSLSRQQESAFTSAVVYLVLGAVASVGLHGLGVDLLDPLDDAELIERVAEFAVIVALFASGLRLDRPLSWRQWDSTVRLIAIVMPLTIGAVTLFATTAMGLSLGAAVILGAVLAPTDPVLASSVQVGPPGEPDESEPRFALTSEAGLNDGLAFPFVMLGLFIVTEGGSSWVGEWLIADVLYAIAVGAVLGAAGGYGLAALAAHMRLREWLRADLDAWLAVTVVLAIYGMTELAGAYGFIAAFVGGLAFRRHEVHAEHHQRVHSGARLVENLTELAMVLLLGSTVTLAGLGEPGIAGWLLVPILLLAIRPAVTMLGFVRSPIGIGERAFIAWFGIRGIGTFYYLAFAIGAGALTDAEAALLYWTAIICVGSSILVHGITSHRAVRWLEARRGGY